MIFIRNQAQECVLVNMKVKDKSIPENAKQEQQQDDDDDEEEYGTEVIPRCLPTPMEKKKLDYNSQNKQYDQKISSREANSTASASGTKSFQILYNSGDEALGESRQFLHPTFEAMVSTGNNTSKGVNTPRRNDSIRQGQQYHQQTEEVNCIHKTERAINSVKNDNNKQMMPSCSVHDINTTNLVERTSSILHHLSNIGLIPSSQKSNTSIKCQEQQHMSEAGEKYEEAHEHFLSLLYYMVEEVSKEEGHDNYVSNHHGVQQKMKLDGLLYILEQLLEQSKSFQKESETWKDLCHKLQLEQRNSTASFNPSFIGTPSAGGSINGPSEPSAISSSQNSMIQSSQTISLLQQENEVLRRQLMQVDPSSQLMELQSQLTDKHMECQRLEQIVHSLEKEQNHLTNLYEGKDMTNTRIGRDIVALKTENETMANENGRLHSEIIKLEQCINVYEKRLHLAEENAHASMISRNEVMAKWNTTLKERTRLESEIGQYSQEISVMKQQLLFSNDEKNRLLKQIKMLENDAQKHVAELSVSNSEKRQIAIELDVLKQSLDSARMENHQLGQDLDSSRMNNDLSSKKTFELQQLSTKMQYDAEAFRNMASELEMERDAMKSLLEEERKKINKLQNVISEAEIRDVTASEQIQKLVREKALFVTKLNEANARNERDARLRQTPFKPVCLPNNKEQQLYSHKTPESRCLGKQNKPKEKQPRITIRSSSPSINRKSKSNSSVEPDKNDTIHKGSDSDKRIFDSPEDDNDTTGVTIAESVTDETNMSNFNQQQDIKISEKPLSLLDYVSAQDSVSI